MAVSLMLGAKASTLIRLVVTAACLVLAYCGFCTAYPVHGPRQPLQYLELAYTSVQLALGQFPADLRGRSIPVSLQIARFALPMSAAWATFSLIWAQFGNRARGWNIGREGDHLVVLGEGLLAEGLVKGELGRKGRVIAWVEDAAGKVARLTDDRRGAFVARSHDKLDLKGLGLETARCFVGAATSDSINIEAARQVIDYVVQARKPGDPLQVLVRVDDPALQSALENRLAGQDRRDRLELRLASAPQLLAREFLLANPVDRLASLAGAPVRLCWVGWSPLAEALLVRILASVHFNHGQPLDLIVVDKNAAKIEAAFLSRHSGARDIASIRFETLQDDVPGLVADWLADQMNAGALNAVFLTSADASIVLSTALAIEARLGREPVSTPPLYGHLPEAGPDAIALVEDSLLSPFGSLRSLADPEALLQERHDEIARSIHDFYLEGRFNAGEALGDRPPLAEWPDLPESVRDENRLVADCYQFKLRGIRATIVEGAGEGLRFTADEVEALAEAEHRRWMAAKLLAGWRWAAVRDDATKRHPDLVPYAQLTEAVRDLDREQVRMIPRILSLVHRRAIRDLTIAFDAPTIAVIQEASLKTALARAADAYPDRHIVVLGDFDNETSRALLLTAFRIGVPVSLIVRTPASRLIEGAASADRKDLAAMIRGAHRIFDLARSSSQEWRPTPDLQLSFIPDNKLGSSPIDAAAA